MSRHAAVVFVVAVVLAAVGCAVHEGAGGEAVEPYVNLKQILGATPPEVAALVGEPRQVTPITSDPSQMPGEFRQYAAEGIEALQVRFRRGRVVSVTAWLASPEATAENAVGRVGIDVRGKSARTAPAAKWWHGIAGAREVGAMVDSFAGPNSWKTVQIKGE